MSKHYSNYTKEEFYEKFQDFPSYKVDVVYSYYHHDKSVTVLAIARKNHISLSTLYRYVEEFKRHS